MIWCPSCHKFKPATEFYNNRNKKNGKQTFCKECTKKAVKNCTERRRNGGDKLRVGRHSVFSDATVAEMKEYRKAGFTYKEIAEFVGAKESTVSSYFSHRCTLEERTSEKNHSERKTPKMEIIPKFQEIIDNHNHTKEASMPPKTNSIPKASLSDFQPRELIKHLYNLGYRIEDGKLVCLVKQTVNLKDIINA